MPDRFRDANKPMLDLVPPFYKERDPEQIVSRYTGFLDDEFIRWDDILDELKNVKSPTKATNQQIAYLYTEKGFDPPLMASATRRRNVLFDLPSYIKRKGDPKVVRDVIIALTGLGVDAVALWSDDRYWVFGKSKFGSQTKVGINYVRRSENAFVIGSAVIGKSKIGTNYVNRRLAYTIQLRLTRPPTSSEQKAIEWACRYFKRAEDHCDIYYPTFASAYWTVGVSLVGRTTKVRPSCWVFGRSKFGVTTVICTPVAVPPNPVVSPTSPGTWVPNYYGGGSYTPPPLAP